MLTFSNKDFYHLVGFQHLKDIALPRNRNITIEKVLNGKITDVILSQSKYYDNRLNDEKNIKERICEMQYLEDYLDTNNIIKIFSTKEIPFLYSDIKAEYIIESSILKRNKTVYIFLKERKEQADSYCIVSFFVKKNLTYGGTKLYWMLKRKIVQGRIKNLYKHPNYVEKNDNN